MRNYYTHSPLIKRKYPFVGGKPILHWEETPIRRLRCDLKPTSVAWPKRTKCLPDDLMERLETSAGMAYSKLLKNKRLYKGRMWEM